MNEKPEKIHLGIYGIAVNEQGELLVIKKARGPYRGKYDLPGGRLEFGETIDQCLRREFLEEAGLDILEMEFLGVNEYQCRYEKEAGVLNDFHHVGIYYKVRPTTEDAKNIPDRRDSEGALFIPVYEIRSDNTSPIAYEMILRHA